MKNEFVNSFLLLKGKYFPTDKLEIISKNMESSDKAEYVVNLTYRNAILYTILYWFLPLFWILDRFFLKDPIGGLLKLFFPLFIFIPFLLKEKLLEAEFLHRPISMVVLGSWIFWVIVDGITVFRRAKRLNYTMLLKTLDKIDYEHKFRNLLFPIILILCASVTSWVLGRSAFEEQNSLKIVKNTFSENVEMINESNNEKYVKQSKLNMNQQPLNKKVAVFEDSGNSKIILSDNDEKGEEKMSNNEVNENEYTSVKRSNDPFGNAAYDKNKATEKSEGKEYYGVEAGNNFGKGSGDGSGVRTDKRILDRKMNNEPRKSLTSPNIDNLEIKESSEIFLTVIVNNNGDIVNVMNNRAKTTTTNLWLINEIKKRVMSEVKYNTIYSNIATQELEYIVNIKPN